MSNSHIKSTLPIRNVSTPIDENTKALFHYNWHPFSHDGSIRPLGSYPDDEGCVLYYDFSNKQDYAIDLSGNDNHGYINNCEWTHGRNGKAVKFNGTNSFIQLSNPLGTFFSNSFSVSLWVYTSDRNRAIFFGDYASQNASNINFEMTSSGSLRIYWNGSPDIYCDAIVPLNQWTHISFVRDKESSKVYFYLNGSLVSTYNGALTDVIANSLHMIGRDARSGATVLDGSIYKFYLHVRALSPEEVLSHYNEGIYTIRKNGKFNGSIAIEEATENLIGSKSLSSGWNVANSGSSTCTRTFEIEDGIPLLKLSEVSVYASYPRVLGVPLTSTVSGDFSCSFEARSDTPGAEINLRLYENGTTKVTHTAVLTTSWTKYSFFTNTSSVLDRPYLNPLTTGAEYYLRSIQVEKGISTSFIDGARDNGRLIYRNPIQDASQFTISFWCKLLKPRTGTGYETLLYFGNKEMKNSLVVDIYSNSRFRFFTYNSAGDSAQIAQSDTIHEREQWYHVAVVRDSSRLYGYVNGEQVATVNNVGTVSLGEFMVLGDRLDALNRESNVFIDELRLDSIARTEDEILAWYVSGAPFFPHDFIKPVG